MKKCNHRYGVRKISLLKAINRGYCQCEGCGKYFRLSSLEYWFYRQLNAKRYSKDIRHELLESL